MTCIVPGSSIHPNEPFITPSLQPHPWPPIYHSKNPHSLTRGPQIMCGRKLTCGKWTPIIDEHHPLWQIDIFDNNDTLSGNPGKIVSLHPYLDCAVLTRIRLDSLATPLEILPPTRDGRLVLIQSPDTSSLRTIHQDLGNLDAWGTNRFTLTTSDRWSDEGILGAGLRAPSLDMYKYNGLRAWSPPLPYPLERRVPKE